MVFKSKVGYELLLPVFGIFIAIYMKMLYDGAPSETILTISLIFIPVLAFILNLFFHTIYTIADGQLIIKCGIFPSQQVNINTITSIRKTKSIIGSPAPSLDRIQINYNKYDLVIISPKDKIGFITKIKEYNPAVEVDLN